MGIPQNGCFMMNILKYLTWLRIPQTIIELKRLWPKKHIKMEDLGTQKIIQVEFSAWFISWKNSNLKWMTWVSPHFRKPPYWSCVHQDLLVFSCLWWNFNDYLGDDSYFQTPFRSLIFSRRDPYEFSQVCSTDEMFFSAMGKNF
jgi:hypothetical protein